MEWWEKEEAFESVYSKGRQAKNLWRYIPDKISKAVEETDVDPDGYWIYLNDGYVAYDGGEDCHIIHEYNITDLKKAIKTIIKEHQS